MYIPSVSFYFLVAALKRLPRAIEAEIKQLMSAQLTTHLAVCMVVVKHMFNFEFTVMRASDYKE